MALHNGQSPTSDISPVSGDLVFPPGNAVENRQKIIEITILQDNVPETPEVSDEECYPVILFCLCCVLLRFCVVMLWLIT